MFRSEAEINDFIRINDQNKLKTIQLDRILKEQENITNTQTDIIMTIDNINNSHEFENLNYKNQTFQNIKNNFKKFDDFSKIDLNLFKKIDPLYVKFYYF